MKADLLCHDIWGNDQEGYDNNQTCRTVEVSVEGTELRHFRKAKENPDSFAWHFAFSDFEMRTMRIEHGCWPEYTLSVSEGVHGRRHVPKYTILFREE